MRPTQVEPLTLFAIRALDSGELFLRRRTLYPTEVRDHTSKVMMQPHTATLLHTEEDVRLIRAMWYGGIIAQLWEKNKGLCAWQSSCTQAVKSLFSRARRAPVNPRRARSKMPLHPAPFLRAPAFVGSCLPTKAAAAHVPRIRCIGPLPESALLPSPSGMFRKSSGRSASLGRSPLPPHPCCAPVTIRLSPGG